MEEQEVADQESEEDDEVKLGEFMVDLEGVEEGAEEVA